MTLNEWVAFYDDREKRLDACKTLQDFDAELERRLKEPDGPPIVRRSHSTFLTKRIERL